MVLPIGLFPGVIMPNGGPAVQSGDWEVSPGPSGVGSSCRCRGIASGSRISGFLVFPGGPMPGVCFVRECPGLGPGRRVSAWSQGSWSGIVSPARAVPAQPLVPGPGPRLPVRARRSSYRTMWFPGRASPDVRVPSGYSLPGVLRSGHTALLQELQYRFTKGTLEFFPDPCMHFLFSMPHSLTSKFWTARNQLKNIPRKTPALLRGVLFPLYVRRAFTLVPLLFPFFD